MYQPPAHRVRLLGALLGALLAACGTTPDDRPETADYVITAILEPQCAQASCHTGAAKAHQLAFDTIPNSLLAFSSKQRMGKGTGTGTMIETVSPGDAESSDLYLVLTGAKNPMPPVSPLPQADIELIRRWIDDGAVGYTPPP